MGQNFFQMTHLVTFEETNLVGNVYYTNYFSWQGRCRELFLHEHAADIVGQIESGTLRLVTAHASCDFADEFRVFDEVVVRMKLLRLISFGVSLSFEYLRASEADIGGTGAALARGRQDIKFLRRSGGQWELTEIPAPLADTFRRFSG